MMVFREKSYTFATILRITRYKIELRVKHKHIKYMKQRITFILFAAVLLFSACGTPKNIVYFQDLTDGQIQKLASYKGITLKHGDMISIVVNTKSAELSNLLNMPVSSQIIGAPQQVSLNQGQGTSGYTIDSEGNIEFPLIGKVHLGGMTREEVAATIKQQLEQKNVAINPVVTVEFLNMSFSVLGEVTKPGKYEITKDKITIMEAIGTAEDMTIYGMRDSVVVFREEDGRHETYVLNMLKGSQVIESPAYYLQQNDVVYVKPNNYRKRQSSQNGNQLQSTSFWISLASLLTTAAVLLK